MSGMTKPVSREKKDRSRPWQRAATRAAILAAARRLIERVGMESLSLTAVAREADFAPATVFAYFANKNDLFLSVLADDLARFAHSMRHGGAFAADMASEPETAAVSPSRPDQRPPRTPSPGRLRLVEKPGTPAGTLSVETCEPAPQNDMIAELQRDLSGEHVEGAHEESAAADPERETIQQELARLGDAVARLESRPVDQWLERRLREFERGLAALENRPEKTEIAGALAGFDQTLRQFATRVEQVELRHSQGVDELMRTMRERGEQIEKRLKELMSDVDAADTRALSRIDALENAAFAVAPEFFRKDTPVPSVPAPAAEPDTDTAARQLEATPQTESAAAADAPPETGKSFLSEARRSALAAAEAGEKSQTRGGALRRVSRRTLVLVAVALGLAAALIWAGILFRALAVPARHYALQPASAMAPATHLVRVRSRLVVRAEAGDAKAQLALGLRLLDGRHKNAALSARWLAAAAQKGEAVAAYRLGMLYHSGLGVPVDEVQAFRWLQFAAQKGNCKAMHALAVAYAEGWGTEKNPAAAAQWFERAAALGVTDAQFDLGVLYEQGMGVPASRAQAYKWYLIAAAAGDRGAEARVDALKPQLSSDDVAAAEVGAASFKPAALDHDANMAPALASNTAG